MLSRDEISSLRISQGYLALALQARGVEVEILDRRHEVVLAQLGEHRELILDVGASQMPYPAAVVANEKSLAKRLLHRAGLSVPEGKRFSRTEREDAVAYAERLGFPVVVKPCYGAHGTQVHLDLDSAAEVERAIAELLAAGGDLSDFLVEQQVEGREHRVFITHRGDYAVLRRDPPIVVGDGQRSVRQLVEAETERRLNPRLCCEGPILIDAEVERLLTRQGLSLDAVPERDATVRVRANSNLSTGASCDDVTGAVHPSLVEIARRALEAFAPLPLAGVDIICRDARAQQEAGDYHLLELNTLPGVGMHMAPGAGPARDVAGVIADLLFPETCSANPSRDTLQPVPERDHPAGKARRPGAEV